MSLPKVYPILDSSFIPRIGRISYLEQLGLSLTTAGIEILEYRNKLGSDAEVLFDARILRASMPGIRLIMDDRVDVAMAAAFDGVHVDAGDIPPPDARLLMGSGAIIGTSASDEPQLTAALSSGVDYIAFGPVFPTSTKQTSAPPIGIEGVRRFRALAGAGPKLVAAAGITLESAPAILRAGADCLAVSSAIFAKEDPSSVLRKWLDLLQSA